MKNERTTGLLASGSLVSLVKQLRIFPERAIVYKSFSFYEKMPEEVTKQGAFGVRQEMKACKSQRTFQYKRDAFHRRVVRKTDNSEKRSAGLILKLKLLNHLPYFCPCVAELCHLLRKCLCDLVALLLSELGNQVRVWGNKQPLPVLYKQSFPLQLLYRTLNGIWIHVILYTQLAN